MYLLIARAWFLFAARCALYLLFILASAFFVVNSLLARKLPNTCTEQSNMKKVDRVSQKKCQSTHMANALAHTTHMS